MITRGMPETVKQIGMHIIQNPVFDEWHLDSVLAANNPVEPSPKRTSMKAMWTPSAALGSGLYK